MTSSSSPRVQSFTRAHARGALELFAAEGWGTYTADPERTVRALSAPGCTTLLAFDGATVVALVQLQSDGEIQAHLSNLIVARSWRRRGLGRQLLHQALKRAGGLRIDVLTETEAFYESLGGQRTPGFRLIQQDLNLDGKPDRPQVTLPEVAAKRDEAHAQISAEGIPRGAISLRLTHHDTANQEERDEQRDQDEHRRLPGRS